MSPSYKRYIGLALILASVIVFVLNLQRVAGLGMSALGIVLLITGVILISLSRKKV